MGDVNKEVEAILFAAGRTVSVMEFQSLLGLKNPGLVTESIKCIIDEYNQRESPLMVVQEEDGWKLTVKEKYLGLVQKINPHTELSKTILETLSVIAWKQPMIQSDVIKIRTNKAYDHISELERLGFISKERYGRSYMIKVTQKFLDYFDLPDASAIKDAFGGFKDIGNAVQKKVGEFEKSKKTKDKAEGKSEDGGVSTFLETFVDELPEMNMPKKGVELEVYDVPEDQLEKESETSEEDVMKDENGEENSKVEEIKESPGEKTRRIAKELLAEEELEKQDDDAEDISKERFLHPQLEEFIAGSMEELAPKSNKSRDEVVKHDDEEDKESTEKDGEVSESEETDDKSLGDEEETDGSAKKEPVAEEYPGQFSKESE
ncbi:SMC-Scp complex subunit ScpB [Candidatus Woesearchaeota archaeon]|nr:SMC-Scp complex subunit ScpB [Candidatus Woesearchaeota archaeon]